MERDRDGPFFRKEPICWIDWQSTVFYPRQEGIVFALAYHADERIPHHRSAFKGLCRIVCDLYLRASSEANLRKKYPVSLKS